MRQLKLSDIAELTGFSASTVSRVLNDDPRISPETKSKVRAVIDKTGYTINPIARGLKTRKTNTIGLIAPELVNDFFMSLAQGAEKELTARGYSMILCSSMEEVEHETRQIRLLLEKWVDGVLIIPVGSVCSHYSLLTQQGIPFVAMDRIPEDIPCDAVLTDNIAASRRITEAVISKGYSRIGFIGGNMDLTSAKERFMGYREALKAASLEYDESIVRFGDFHIQSGALLTEQLLALPRPPEYLYIANHYMHIGAVRYLLRSGQKERPRARIACFDTLEATSALGFSDFSAAQPMEEIGREAAKLVLERIQNSGEKEPEIIRLPARLIDHTKSYHEELTG